MNIIERTLELAAPLEKVWGLIGTAEGFHTWFKVNVVGEWVAGNDVTITWASGTANEIRIAKIAPPNEFAFQWHPGVCGKLSEFPESELTTVTFRLSGSGSGTTLHLTETGFDAIPDDRRLKVLGLNTEGWDEELEAIRSHAEA